MAFQFKSKGAKPGGPYTPGAGQAPGAPAPYSPSAPTVTSAPGPMTPTQQVTNAATPGFGAGGAVQGSVAPKLAPVTPKPGLGSPELDKLYEDIYKEHQGSWAGTEKGINAQTAMNQRRAAEINASMGRNVAGGFGSMMASALIGGQQNMLNARQTWADRGRQLQLGQLDRSLQEQHRLQDLEQSATPVGSLDDPMPFSAAPPGGSTSADTWVSYDPASDRVVIRGAGDGKYYYMTSAEYQQRTGRSGKGAPAPYVRKENTAGSRDWQLDPDKA